MSNPGVPKEELQRTYKAYVDCGCNQVAAAEILGISRHSVRTRVRRFHDLGLTLDDGDVSYPVFPDDDLEAEELLEHQEKRFEQRLKYHQSLRWFPIKLKSELPIGICVFGDPHLGSNGCNVPLLRRDVNLVSQTPGCYGLNIGDTTDNWGGRLIRLYAENDVSRQTERRLARWFLEEAGIKWIVWLFGNHDEMHSEFSTFLRTIGGARIPMIDWRAKFRLVFPNGRECRIDAAHNHKGHSMWNELHGQERAANMDEDADIYIAGHHHTWAIKMKEMPDGRVIHLGRARGYKWLDTYAERLGFSAQEQGASVLYVIRPTATAPLKFIKAFPDIEDGIEYLKLVREKEHQKGVK